MAKRTSKRQKQEEAKVAVATALAAPPPDDGRIEWALTPTEERWGTATAHRFASACGRYSVCRVESSLGDGGVHFGAERRTEGRWDLVEHAKEGIGYAKRFRTLNAACEAVERFHREKAGRGSVETNREELVRAAECRWPVPVETTASSRQRNNTSSNTPEGEEEMATATKKSAKTKAAGPEPLVVKEADARALLAACGVPNAEECPAKKLTGRLNNIAELAEGAEPAGDALKLFRAISKAREDGRAVEVVGERPVTKNKPGKNGKIPKVEKNGDRDRFGSILGSSNATVNAILKKTPMGFREIVEATGLTPKQVRYAHLDSLVESGYAVKVEKKWALKK